MSKEELREHVIDEIIYTEKNYVNRLSTVTEVYILPLQEILERDDFQQQVTILSLL